MLVSIFSFNKFVKKINMVNVLAISGFDPSGGAGILADIKTFESNGVYGLGVCTALTYQNDISFEDVDWVNISDIKRQIEVLSKRLKFDFVKIGLVQNLNDLELIIDFLLTINNQIKIIWDPILKASAGFEFHNSIQLEKLKSICSKIFLITPNYEEAKKLFPNGDIIKNLKELSIYCSIYVKTFFNTTINKFNDLLIIKQIIINFEVELLVGYEKHGSGCVISSAIASNLANGKELTESCELAKSYTTNFLKSTKGLLGKHYNKN